ncbi:MAG: MBL fold metallo-hydrolase [Solirubrobacteraceae bacterium]
MIFRQITHDDLGCASYLVGDEDAGVAAVVDPKLDVDEYLRLARYLGVRIEHVLETHNHADHVSGHGRLVAATGATVHINRLAEVEYPHEPIDDGWELALGELRINAIHAPGHRPEHTCFALTDTARGEQPWALLTGDALFVGDIGRPDLAVDKDEGARELFRALHGRLLDMPDTCEVWPGHLGGSLCGGPGMSLKISSTIGYERTAQPLLRIGGEDEFAARATAGLAPQPPNFHAIVARNRGPLEAEQLVAQPLEPAQVAARQAEAALVVDVRTDLQFDEAHLPDAVSITALRAGFGSRLAWLVEPGQAVVLVGRDDDEARAAVELAAAVGVDRVAGYLHGGMTAWREERRPVRRTPRITVDELYERRERAQVLDVRDPGEWEAGHIPGSLLVPYHDLHELPPELDPERPVAVICSSGQRAAVAASLLLRHGAREVWHVVDGGVPAWQRAGHPVERG